MAPQQRGVSLVFVVIVIVAMGVAVIAVGALFRETSQTAMSAKTSAALTKVSSALEQFASVTRRLPCPANPTLTTGLADPETPTTTCNSPEGTVPWKTLSLRREDEVDAWGWKISYRVYTGTAGSLTQEDGVSMVKCDLDEPTPAGRTPEGRCKDTYDTTEGQFLEGKGFSIVDFGMLVGSPSPSIQKAAFVLISHGPSGRGAYPAFGVRNDPPVNIYEVANAGVTEPFHARPWVTADILPDNPNFFDDVILYQRLDEFVGRINLGGRKWPESASLAGVTFDITTVGAMVGPTFDPGNQDLGRSVLTVPGPPSADPIGTITGFDSSGAADFSYSSGGLGIGGNGSGLLSNQGGEYVRIVFATKATNFGLTLFDFGSYMYAGASNTERAEISFYNGAVLVGGAPITIKGCRDDGGAASFSIESTSEFDRVEIKPIGATPNQAATSAFRVSAFATCTGFGACNSPLYVAGNSCPTL
jgi:Tfp pilus assembly protein PilV